MKKIIGGLIIVILSITLILILIFVFNPFNLRNKIIGSAINSYFNLEPSPNATIEDAKKDTDTPNKTTSSTKQTPKTTNTVADKNPLLNEEQEKTLETFGVNVESLPQDITPEMQACLVQAVGEERAMKIASGESPNLTEIIKARKCLNQ